MVHTQGIGEQAAELQGLGPQPWWERRSLGYSQVEMMVPLSCA